MDAPDEMAEAVARAIRQAESGWRSALWPRDPGERGAPNRLGFIARAVLSVPALAEVIARDAKVREIVAEPFGVVLDRAIALGRIAALYPEAGK